MRAGVCLLAAPMLGAIVLSGPVAQAGPAAPRAAVAPQAVPMDGPPAKPRVCVSIRPSVSKVVAGVPYGYTVRVANCGDVPAPRTRLSVTMPRGVKLRGASGEGCSTSSTRLTCSFGTVAYKRSERVRLAVAPSSRLRAGSKVVATARATCKRCAPRTDTDTRRVTRRADVSQQNDSHDHVLHPGDSHLITLSTRNAGPSQASGIVVEDKVPDRLRLTGVDADKGLRCSQSGELVRCTAPRLDPGDSIQSRMYFDTPDGEVRGRTHNSVVASADEHDPDLSNNRSGSHMMVQARPAGSGSGAGPGELDGGVVEDSPGDGAGGTPGGGTAGGAGSGGGSGDGCQTEGPGPAPTSGPCAPGSRAEAEGGLPFTGIQLAGLVAVGLAIAGLGVLLVRAARRSRF